MAAQADKNCQSFDTATQSFSPDHPQSLENTAFRFVQCLRRAVAFVLLFV
jgi:hypothetical protein